MGFYSIDVPMGHDLWGRSLPCPNCTDKSWSAKRMDERSGLSMAMRSARFETGRVIPHQAEATAAIRSVVEQGFGMVALTGPVGVGKSYLLACACNAVIEKGAYYNATARLLDQLRGGYGAGEGDLDFTALWNMVESVHLLALDEFSVFSPSAWAKEKFRTLLSERHNRCLESITLLAGNDPTNSWPPWLISRLRGAGAAIVHMHGQDLRAAMGGKK